MSRRAVVYGVLAALLAALAAAVSCGNEADERADLESVVLRLRLPGAASQTSLSDMEAASSSLWRGEVARTVHPDMISGWTYTISFDYQGGPLGPAGTCKRDPYIIPSEYIIDPELEGIEVPLKMEVGTWAFTAHGWQGTVEVARSATNKVEITEGRTATVSLAMGPLVEEGAQGYFLYDVTLPEEEEVYGELRLYTDREGTTSAATRALGPGRNLAVDAGTRLSLPPGEYLLTVSAEWPDGKSAAADIVHIYKGLDTRFTLNLFPTGPVLTYDPAGGSLSGGTPGGLVTYGATVTLPSSGTKRGYVLGGFTLSEDMGGLYASGATFLMPDGDVTATAVWASETLPPRNLSYDPAGGELTFSPGVTAGGPVIPGMVVTLPSSGGGVTGHTLAGFTLSGVPEAESEKTIGGTFSMPDSDVTATAVWEANVYVVTFDVAGGDGDGFLMSVIYGEPYGALPEPQRMKAEFQGWYTDAGERIEYDTLVTLTENHTLYAHWDLLVLVMFDSAGGDAPSMAQKIVRYGSGRTYGALAVAERDGYTREDGNPWYTERFGGEPVWATTPVTRTDDHTLYAHWTAKTMRLEYNENNKGWISRSVDNFKTVTYGQPYETLLGEADFSYIEPGYTFGGWWTEATGGEQITEASIVMATDDHTIYAHWTQGSPPVAVPITSITFDEPSYTLQSPGAAQYTPLIEPEDASNKTLAWSCSDTEVAMVDATGHITALKAGTATITARAIDGSGVSGSYTLITEVITSIIFDRNQGTGGTDSVTAVLGSPMPDITPPTRVNYTFQGYWRGDTQYYDSDGTNIANWDVDLAGAILSAKWRGKPITITFSAMWNVTLIPAKPTKTVYYMEKYGSLPPSHSGPAFESINTCLNYYVSESNSANWTGRRLYVGENTTVILTADHIVAVAFLDKYYPVED